MKQSLVTRMIVRVWGSTMILFLAILATTFYYGKKEVLSSIEEHSRNMAQNYAERFDGEFRSAAAAARTAAAAMETQPLGDDKEIDKFLNNVLVTTPAIYGTCLAFEPYAYQKNVRVFAPYYYRVGGKTLFRQLANPEYNYFSWPWYKEPIRTGRPYWTEPYFDKGGGDALMITYSHPFMRDGKRGGVATVDIALTDLSNEVNAIRVLRTGYGFIVSGNGSYVTFPDEAKIMKARIGDDQPALAAAFAKKSSGIVEARDPLRGEDAWIVFTTVESAHLTLGVVYPVAEALRRVYDFEKNILWLGSIGMFCLMLVVALVSKSIVTPIVNLAGGAREVSSGNLDFALPAPRSNDEVGLLTDAFNDMVRQLKNRLAQLQRTTAEKERIVSELAIAREIQLSLLPGRFPARPGLTGFDLHGRSIPARQVGGDFYDFFWLDNERIGLVIGDVSDKGTPAALFMALCRTLLRATALRGSSPDACLREVNRVLCPENRRTMFVTVLYGIFRVTDGAFRFCNAGHLPPLLVSPEGLRSIDAPGGMALGIAEDAAYESHSIVIKPGSLLFLYTDGITDAVNPAGKDFAVNRLANLLPLLAAKTPAEIVDAVMRDVAEFAAEAEQFDDLTALALRFDHPPTAAVNEEAEVFELPARLSEIPALAEKVATLLGQCGVPEKAVFAINLALEELIVNVISYGYSDEKEHFIRVEARQVRAETATIVLIDDGRPFDPIADGVTAKSADFENRGVGGQGLRLVRTMMDEVHYRRDAGKNITTLVKKFRSVS